MVKERHLLAEALNRTYKDEQNNEIHALADFYLEVKNSEIVALVGPSGCGKSTFLRIVSGLDLPQGGAVYYNGTSITEPNRDCGFMFQDANLFPWLSVYDNIAFGLRTRGVFNKERAKVQQYISLMGLSGFEKAYPHQISGGMASRAALARTFIQDPGLILLDEPLSSLDAFTSVTIQQEIINIWQQEKPMIILVTHDIEEAVALSDRVVILSSRPSRVIGEVKIDLKHPRDRTSSDFIALRRAVSDVLEIGV